MTLAVAPNSSPRELTLLKAVGLDRANPEQRELALHIADRYGLDLMLKHLVLIEGRPYITRDALLHIAHRSGQLDGIETTEPVIVDDFWRASCTVYRKDMSRGFTYGGRYPTKGGNQKFAPEMAIKVAEVMALRRAFDVAAPTQEERWDVEVPAEAPAPKPTLAEKVAEKAKVVSAGLTKAQFMDGLRDNGIRSDEAKSIRAAMYPGNEELTDVQRQALLNVLLEGADVPAAEPAEAESVAIFPLTEEEKLAVGGGLS